MRGEIQYLKKDIENLAENIEAHKKAGKTCEFEEKLLKAWKRRLKKLQNTL